jgi:LysR family transcriptional activator of nhaA
MNALNFNHLRYFWAVAHEGNLTRTAKRLNVTQSAVSVQIRKLEERLGHALFERRGRELQLTEAGRIALDHADQIFAVGEELLGTLRDAGRNRHVLRLGALATLSRNFQVDFLQPMLGRADVEVVLRSGSSDELMRALAAHSLDVVLSNHAPMTDTLTPFVAHRVAEQQVSLIGTPQRLGASGERRIEALLTAHPVILPTANSTIRTGFDALARQLGVRPQIAAEVDDMAMMRLLAREDVGLAVLPGIVVKDELASGLLIDVQPLPDVAETFFAITAERRFPNPLVKELLQR